MQNTKSTKKIRRQRQVVIEQLEQLEQIRRGSVTEQYVEVKRADGTKYQRGPYPVYTFKQNARTVSKRITDPELVKLYREQIDNGRAFQEKIADLIRLGEALSDAAVDEYEVKKTPRSSSKKTAK